MTKINNSSYFERLYRMDQMRQASGKFGDIRDIPLFTSSGREDLCQQIYNNMFENSLMERPKNFQEAKMLARMQREANQMQYTMAAAQSAPGMLETLSTTLKDFLKIFGIGSA